MKNFQILNKLGDGAFSTVFKVKRQSDGKEYAVKKVKMMNLSGKEKENALNEVRILASIQNINIISYKESFFEDQTSTLCIVMEYADGGDLYNKIINYKKKGQFIPEKDVWHFFVQIVRGLQALHELNIIHRDIKCANLFLTKEGVMKLGDLNVSKVAKRGMLQTQTGTPYYASPEVWKDKPYDSKSDIWSVGCVLYEMCALNPPFKANDMSGLYQRILKGIYPPIPSIYSSDLVNMIKSMLQQNPSSRPSCNQILGMTSTVNHMSQTLHRMESLNEDSKEGLLNTIKLPRVLGQITDRLPKSQYNSEQILNQKRGSSDPPSRIGQSNNLRDNLQSAKPGLDYGLKGLYPIQEKDEPRSADPARDTGNRHKNALHYQYQMKNQAKGYNAEKENIKQPRVNIDTKAYLQNRGIAIMNDNKSRQINLVNQQQSKQNHVLSNIYGVNKYSNNPPTRAPGSYNYQSNQQNQGQDYQYQYKLNYRNIY